MKVAIDFGLKDANGNTVPATLNIPTEMYYLAKGSNATREDTVALTAIDWECIEMQAMQQEQENSAFWQEEETIILEKEPEVEMEIIPFTSLLPSSKSMSVTEFLGEEPSDEEVQQALANLQELADGIHINHVLTKLEERLSRGSTCTITSEDARVAMKHNKGRFCALANKYRRTFKVATAVGSIAAVAAIGALPPMASPKSTQTRERSAMTLFKVVDKEIDHLLKYSPYKVVSLVERFLNDVGLAYLTLEQAKALMSRKDCAQAMEVLLVHQPENSQAVQVILPSGQTQSMRYLFWA